MRLNVVFLGVGGIPTGKLILYFTSEVIIEKKIFHIYINNHGFAVFNNF